VIRSRTIIGDAAVGADDLATATTITPEALVGAVLAVGITYLGTPPAGTDVTVTCLSEGGGPDLTLVNLVDAITDVTIYPAISQTDNTGAAVNYDAGGRPVKEPARINGRVQVVVDQANAGDSVNVTVILEG